MLARDTPSIPAYCRAMARRLCMLALTSLPLLLLLLIAPQTSGAQNDSGLVTVGSKQFTENVILGHMATLLLEDAGLTARHRAELGGSRFLWEALRRGDIDLYPEYTGTLVEEILIGDEATPETLPDVLATYDLRMTAPLGFNNTYALGMRPEQADTLGIESISDLRQHPMLQFAFSNEFMQRGDGWPALQQAYNLPQQEVRGVDHDISYQGLRSGAADVIDLYSTDAEIDAYDLKVLEDDRDFFTAYKAVFVYRADLSERVPEAPTALEQLEGTISERRMMQLNRRSKIEGEHEARVAASFLSDDLGVEDIAAVGRAQLVDRVAQRTVEHGLLVALSLLVAVFAAIPLGVLAAKRRRLGSGVLLLIGLTYTTPSLALLALMVPPLGLGFVPAAVALFVYSLLPIVWNTYTGLRDIPKPLLESAEALGLSAVAKLRLVELPLALPSIMAGVKVAAVINIGTATLGALIGAGGYGQPILTGIRRADISLILEGTVPAAVMTVIALLLLEGIERLLTTQRAASPASATAP